LIALDPQTQQRTLRPSAEFYGAIARSHALTEAQVREYAPDALPEIFAED